MRGNTYSVEQANNIHHANQTVTGRIMRYDADRGYGFIYKSHRGIGREIFFHKKDFVSRTNGEKARVGSRVTFTMDVYNDKACARNVEVVGHIYDGHPKTLLLPDGQTKVRYKSILKYGRANCYYRLLHANKKITEAAMKEHGYVKEDFDYIYIRTINTEYKIFQTNSPIKGDGRVENLDDYLHYLNKELLMIEE